MSTDNKGCYGCGSNNVKVVDGELNCVDCGGCFIEKPSRRKYE